MSREELFGTLGCGEVGVRERRFAPRPPKVRPVREQTAYAQQIEGHTSAASVVEAFERQVDAAATRDAIRCPTGDAIRRSGPDRGGSVSFEQLDTWSNAIASELIHRRGTKPEPVPLAILAPDLMLAAALGTLKAGKFYVAVNPLHPAPRVQHVLGELDAPLLLCDRGGEVAARHGVPALSVQETVVARPCEGRPGLRFDAGRLAYVLYTSGSTGRPRGVAQSRRDMLHNVTRHRALAIGCEDCMTLISADGFVAAVSNPYVALLGGAALAPYSFKDAGVEGMLEWLKVAGVTVLYAFPSFLRQLAAIDTKQVHDGLRLAYLGGESVLPSDLAAARRLFPAAALSVGLNSSETGLTCLHLVPPGSPLPDPVPAGPPVVDVEVAVLDEHGAPLAPGESGEIEIRSDYVRPRYWGRGAIRDEAAHAPVFDDAAHAPAFRTGDRGRIDVDGIVYHLGRLDGMVKIRGFRVETAEVEAVIAALPEVAEVAVFAAGEDPAAVELAACVVGRGAGIGPAAVRSAVARELPPAMIPTRVLIVDALPRTPNGKLDRGRLARLAAAPGPGATVTPGPRATAALAGTPGPRAAAALADTPGPRATAALAGTSGPRAAALADTPGPLATAALAAVNGSGGSPRTPAGEERWAAAKRPEPDLPARAARMLDGDLRRAAVERRIAEIWSSELGIAAVSAEESFFAVGGTSIMAVSVVARVRSEFG
ncbi:MAG TPA: AMP-binding protein, partial [Solirubrobacteraceae bacterium]|nr:AMP-binding protein [Solirubrobacteraceae bacterium]